MTIKLSIAKYTPNINTYMLTCLKMLKNKTTCLKIKLPKTVVQCYELNSFSCVIPTCQIRSSSGEAVQVLAITLQDCKFNH